jgi:hypothetical protein
MVGEKTPPSGRRMGKNYQKAYTQEVNIMLVRVHQGYLVYIGKCG